MHPNPATRTNGKRVRRQDKRRSPHSAAARRAGHKKSDRPSPFGDERPSCWGIRTRTRKNRTRICCVANYTIPQAVLACNSTLAVCECKGSAFLYTGKASAVFFQKNLKKLTKHAFLAPFLRRLKAKNAATRTMFAPFFTGLKAARRKPGAAESFSSRSEIAPNALETAPATTATACKWALTHCVWAQMPYVRVL